MNYKLIGLLLAMVVSTVLVPTATKAEETITDPPVQQECTRELNDCRDQVTCGKNQSGCPVKEQACTADEATHCPQQLDSQNCEQGYHDEVGHHYRHRHSQDEGGECRGERCGQGQGHHRHHH